MSGREFTGFPVTQNDDAVAQWDQAAGIKCGAWALPGIFLNRLMEQTLWRFTESVHQCCSGFLQGDQQFLSSLFAHTSLFRGPL